MARDRDDVCEACDGTGMVTVEYSDRGELAERVEPCDCDAGDRQADLEVDDDADDREYDELEREALSW